MVEEMSRALVRAHDEIGFIDFGDWRAVKRRLLSDGYTPRQIDWHGSQALERALVMLGNRSGQTSIGETITCTFGIVCTIATTWAVLVIHGAPL